MPSSTKNVKLGVCQIFLDGQDLGYTKGGVEVSVSTDTKQVMVDQFGNTPINEYIMGRQVKVKAPLAESTLEILAMTMPGATVVFTGGAAASGTITFSGVPVNNDGVQVNGISFVFKTSPAAGSMTELPIPSTAAAGAASLAAALQAYSADSKVTDASYSYTAGATVINIKYGNELAYGTTGKFGVEGNAFTLVKTGTAIAVSGATLSGGTDPTSAVVRATTGIGADLLSLARELRLHPVSKTASDLTEDFIVPLASTPGALTFAYKLEDERIYNVEFQGYPDQNGVLFKYGGR